MKNLEPAAEASIRGLSWRTKLGGAPLSGLVQPFLLVTLLALMYLPYIMRGGLLRDDLGFSTDSRNFPTYLSFQSYLSSFITMTARPVSALLHGAAYWFLDANPQAHHGTNLVLFSGSLLLAYRALCQTLGRGVAFVTGAFAAVYPAASGTVFSAMMMNSNLAGLFWAGALCVSSSRLQPTRRDIATVILLILSGLSYESFIPLFPAIFLVRRAHAGPVRGLAARVHAMPVLAALAFIGLYRVAIERLIFHTSFTRAELPINLIGKLGSVMRDGARVAIVDSLRLSYRALRNIEYLAILLLGIGAIAIGMYLAMSQQQPPHGRSVWIGAVGLFVMAHLIFVFSEYKPSSGGFDSRTQGGIRFAEAFLIASTGFLAGGERRNVLRVIAHVGIVCLFVLFAFGMVGQREGWIEAARYNRAVVSQINEAMGVSKAVRHDSLTIVAELNVRNPHLINGEPTFGTSWDLGPALELTNPGKHIRANVYEAKRTRVDPNGLLLDGYWRASFPFYYFRTGERGLRRVKSKSDWVEALSR